MGRNLAKFRDELGLTQEDLAFGSGVKLDTLRSWESGKRSPRIMELLPVAERLGRTIDDLYAEDPPPRRRADHPLVFFKTLGGVKAPPEIQELMKKYEDDVRARLRAAKTKAKSR